MTDQPVLSGTREYYGNHEQSLDCFVQRGFLDGAEEKALFEELKELPWFRVKYLSERHGNQCTTPCWTNFFGGFPELKPFQAIPPQLQALIAKVQLATPNVPYNAVLLRLYFDGQDNIAWHTDGRTFLGDRPTIASLSLGARSSFEMRRMTNCWPCKDTPHGGVDVGVAPFAIPLHGGDLLVMQGRTQAAWHHRVPVEKGRGPRINVNLRYVLPERDEMSVRGVRTFYKYMVCGDAKTDAWDMTAPSFRYADIVRRHGPMHAFVSGGIGGGSGGGGGGGGGGHSKGPCRAVYATASAASAASAAGGGGDGIMDGAAAAEAEAEAGGEAVASAMAAACSTSAGCSVEVASEAASAGQIGAADSCSDSCAEGLAAGNGDAEWACAACTLLNAPSDGRCAACDAPRHETRHRAGRGSLNPSSLGSSGKRQREDPTPARRPPKCADPPAGASRSIASFFAPSKGNR